jgi:hypothetical protein
MLSAYQMSTPVEEIIDSSMGRHESLSQQNGIRLGSSPQVRSGKLLGNLQPTPTSPVNRPTLCFTTLGLYCT